MLISKEMEHAINTQIGDEFQASILYFNMAAYLDRESLPQLAAFFYRQAEEEKTHAIKFLHYVVDSGGQVRIPTIEQTPYDFKSIEEVAKTSLDWELVVTDKINSLMDLAIKENNHIAQDFLRWFVTEQLEEVSTMDTLLTIIRRAGDNLFYVEEYLARNPVVEEGG